MPSFSDDVPTRSPWTALGAALAATLAFGLGLPTATAQDNGGGGDQQAQEDGEAGGGNQGGGGGATLQRSDRMEFDARLIRGERASGAVFLFQRAPRELPSMVERRKTFLEASVRSVLGQSWAEKFVKNRADSVEGDEAVDTQ